MTDCRYPPAPYDWESELDRIDRFDDHLTDEETAERLAEVERLTAPLRRERTWQSVLGLIGSGVIAVLTVIAFVVL